MDRFLEKHIDRLTSIAPLIVFRVLFGFMMAISMARFFLKGWIRELYVDPDFYFTFLGFGWVQPLGELGMNVLFALTFLAAIGIMLGAIYRFSASIFFLCFTYIELIDKTNYLNHYYFISLIAFLLIFLPANRGLSIDLKRKPSLKLNQVPIWTINILKAQLVIVYFFAGLAKLNYDWLIDAMPLKLWLPSLTHIPIVGFLFNYEWTAYAFSWSGAIYDLTIAFFLLNRKTRPFAYLTVLLFHLMTALLFQIGMFPYIMILSTLIFFSAEFHDNIVDRLKDFFQIKNKSISISLTPKPKSRIYICLAVYLLLQITIPMRHILYPGSVYWTEEGYRFSWRVMLMEKAGYAQFQVIDGSSEKKEWVDNTLFLTKQQEKMMSTQPDMILQFAHHLATVYLDKGFKDPQVYCDSRVTLNGRRSRQLINTKIDLAHEKRNLNSKTWITQKSYAQ